MDNLFCDSKHITRHSKILQSFYFLECRLAFLSNLQVLGKLGEEAATLLSDTKEKFDQWEDVYAKSHKVTIEEAIADSERDQVANRLGHERGRKYPNCKCYELMSDLKPKHKK